MEQDLEDGVTTALVARVSVKQIKQSLRFLEGEAAFINAYDDLEEFVFSAFDQDRKRAQAIEFHLSRLRTDVIKVLWPKQLFISLNTIEQLLFLSFKAAPANPYDQLVRLIFENGLHHPGFVLYPLHSFGFLGVGLSNLMQQSSDPSINLDGAGIALTAQTNSLKGSEAFLERTRKRLGIAHKIPSGLLEHFFKSRDLRWYTQNPLIAVRISSYTSGYYENQRILEMKLRISAALIGMMAVLGKQPESEGDRNFSTRSVNNWQTLDIRHFLLFQAAPRKKELSIDCTPMHLNQVEMAELSDLGTDIDPGTWGHSRRAQLAWIQAALQVLEEGFLRHCLIGTKDEVRRRLFRKIMTSINYFRRSLRARTYGPENVVALAIAFETLLSDYYAPGVTATILARLRRSLKGVRNIVQMHAAVGELFAARGSILHLGTANNPTSFGLSQRAYIFAFREVMKRVAAVGGPMPEHPLTALFP